MSISLSHVTPSQFTLIQHFETRKVKVVRKTEVKDETKKAANDLPPFKITPISEKAQNFGRILHETVKSLKKQFGARTAREYCVINNEIYMMDNQGNPVDPASHWTVQTNCTIVAAYIAAKKDVLLTDNIKSDTRFPYGVGYNNDTVKAVLAVPIILPNGDVYGVLEYTKTAEDPPFREADLRLLIILCEWVGIAIKQDRIRAVFQKQCDFNDYLIHFTQFYYAENDLDEAKVSTMGSVIPSSLSVGYGTAQILTQLGGKEIKKSAKRVIAPFIKIKRKDVIPKKVKESASFNKLITEIPGVLLRECTDLIADNLKLSKLIHDTADELKHDINACDVRVYLVDHANELVYLSTRILLTPFCRIAWPIQERDCIVASYVAYSKEPYLIEDIIADDRFPLGIGYQKEMVKSVLCAPILDLAGEIFAVIEFTRLCTEEPFTEMDMDLVLNVVNWMGIAYQQDQNRVAATKHLALNDFVLALSRKYCSERVVNDILNSLLLKFVKNVVAAERFCLYLIDTENDKVIDIYDESIDERSDSIMVKKSGKLRLNKEKGLIAEVFKTGKIVNIKDATKDPRYSKEHDQRPGVLIKSSVLVPIKSVTGDDYLGLIQLINKKRDSYFTAVDERLLQIICHYISLILYYYRCNISSGKKGYLNNIYLDILERAMRPCPQAMENFKETINIPFDFDRIQFYISSAQIASMPQFVLHMFMSLIPRDLLNMENLMQFILTTIKLYRKNPYHNVEHAFTTCHLMYLILKKNIDVFNMIEIRGLLIAALCHDVDHVGYTNNFLKLVGHDLALLYEDSILENHHANITMLLMQNYDIFTDSHNYSTHNKLLSEVRAAILNTDMGLYFKSKIQILELVNSYKFDMMVHSHKELMKALIMTTCDLSVQFKSFDVTKKAVENLYEEFYNEGDREKSMGLCPISIMDREKESTIPEDQIQFLTIVVIPCACLVARILPNLESFEQEAIAVRQGWLDLVAGRGKKFWHKDESVVEN